MTRRLVVIGDALLDRDIDGAVERLSPEAPVPVVDELVQRSRPGGAALAAVLGALDGHPITLVTALAADPPGRELARLLRQAGVDVLDVGLAGSTPEKVRVLAEGRLLLRLDRGGAASAAGALTGEARAALRDAAAVLVSDYGRGMAARADVRHEVAALAAAVPVIWDPHPAGPEPVPGAHLVTPNRAEADVFGGGGGGSVAAAAAERAELLRRRWRADAVVVTLGADGAVVAEAGREPTLVSAPPTSGGDVCGAGDRFASAAAGLLAAGASVREAVDGAVRAATAFVAGGGAGAVARPSRRGDDAPRVAGPEDAGVIDVGSVIARVRSAEGTVVATGGCFDLLHAGHVAMLEAARALGDCLIVCVNSDASVRRLKGPDRPLVPEEDRVAVLQALAAVDAVVVFDEDTPEAVLDRLRPDVFVKGGDYSVDELPEAPLLESWGGRAVIVPYVPGRSTTRLIEEAQVLGTG